MAYGSKGGAGTVLPYALAGQGRLGAGGYVVGTGFGNSTRCARSGSLARHAANTTIARGSHGFLTGQSSQIDSQNSWPNGPSHAQSALAAKR